MKFCLSPVQMSSLNFAAARHHFGERPEVHSLPQDWAPTLVTRVFRPKWAWHDSRLTVSVMVVHIAASSYDVNYKCNQLISIIFHLCILSSAFMLT